MGKGLSIVELTLEEMMADPIVRLTMGRDQVTEQDVRTLVSAVADRLQGRAQPQGIRKPGALG
ncbi:hypothetical protein ACFSM5_19100 [Lacibacterium aquatile]|uniref:Uncharacterized protein n=1 Tax=Lacibacterium aquatile TaxID=1168082 RepID=A0ABW5DWY0_9PROT